LVNTQNAAASINNITTLPANLLCTQCAESMIDNLNSFVSVKHKVEYVSLSQRSYIMLTQMYHQQQGNVNQWLKNMTPSIDVGQLDARYVQLHVRFGIENATVLTKLCHTSLAITTNAVDIVF
jgi:hypothetical protein